MDWPPIIAADTGTRPFARDERRRLELLRQRYRGQPDIFSERELARLRFVRWLVYSGRLPVR